MIVLARSCCPTPTGGAHMDTLQGKAQVDANRWHPPGAPPYRRGDHEAFTYFQPGVAGGARVGCRPGSAYIFPSSSATLRNCSRAASRFSTISAAIMSGAGNASTSSRLSSLSQKMSRLSLSRAINSL